jgi:hypothetical protein
MPPPVHLSPLGTSPPPPFPVPLVFSATSSELLFWLATAICAIAQVAVIRAALAGRTPGASPSVVSRVREFFWVVLPAGLLVVLLAWTWRSLPGRFLETPAAVSAGAVGALDGRATPLGAFEGTA